MSEGKKGQNPQQGQKPEEKNEVFGERFESDTQKIIHRHLENKDDVITDEDIRNVRVGMSPEMDEPTEVRFERDDKIDEVEEKYIGEEAKNDHQPSPDKFITPWDAIDPKQ